MDKRFWLCLVVALLTGQKVLAQEGWSADALLKSAINKMPQCKTRTTIFAVGPEETDRIPKSGQDGEKDSVAHLLTLGNLFKPGRFDLRLERDSGLDGEEEYIVIHFSSKPEKEHLGVPFFTKPTARAINWAMNRMSGKIYIDPSTKEIVRVEGGAPSGVKGSKYGLFKGTLHTLWLRHEQKFIDGSWTQSLTEARLHFDTNMSSARNEFSSTTHFACKEK